MDTTLISDKTRFGAAHLAWVAMFLSVLIWGFGTAEVRPGQLGNTGNWYRIGLVLLAAAVGSLVLLKNSNRILSAFPGPLFLLLIYGLLAIISSQYIPAYSFYSMWKAFEVIVDVIVIAAILSEAKAQNASILAYRIILFFFTALLVVYWVEALAMPSKAFIPSRGIIPFTMQGVLPVCNGNGLAFISALVAFAAICRVLRPGKTHQKIFLGVFLIGAMITMIVAQSRTSLVGFAAALIVYLFLGKRHGWLLLVAVVSAVALLSTSLTGTAEQYLMRGQSTELFTSLSGRTQGWKAAWTLFQQSPIFGLGFAAASRVMILGTAGASTLHGSVFDVLVGVGLLGLIPWAVAIIWISIRLLRLSYSRNPWFRTPSGRSIQAEMVGVLVLLLIRSSTSSGLAMHEHSLMLLFALAAYTASMTRAARKVRTDDTALGSGLRSVAKA